MRRRRRFLRDETVAPWVTLLVIAGVWWAAAALIGNNDERLAGVGSRADPVAEAAAPGLPADNRAPPVGPGDRAAAGPADAPPPVVTGDDLVDLAARDLVVPVKGVEPSALRSMFDEQRGGGRRHEALDILAPRGTAVVAVDAGRIAKLFTSARGGLTIYQFDESERYCYYYAHLDGYTPDLNEGQQVVRGQTLGYVGTTGNAPPGTPHLHFAIFRLGDDKRWWDGVPIDPYPVLR